MNQKEFAIKTEIIRETFGDERKIKCLAPSRICELDEDSYQGGDIFMTEDGDLIDFEFQLVDFDESELIKFIEFAEELYEKIQKHVSIYLLCPQDINVCVIECPIKSDADFTIRLAKIQEDSCQIILNGIKNKVNSGEMLDCDDLKVLSELPVRCDRKDRHYYRMEYLKIINRIHN